MNNEIAVMIELQHYWDNVMKCEAEILRLNKSIATWEQRLKDIKLQVSKKDSDIRDLKLKIKKNELDLEEVETKSEKTEQRKNQLKSEREIDAQNNELILLHERKGKIEDSLIEMLDILDKVENELIMLKKEKDETETQVAIDLKQLNARIDEKKNESGEFRGKFDHAVISLSPQIKSKFLKLISSKDGIAIASLSGDTCSHCNFKVPSAIAASASGRKSIETCTNCGRFIY